MRSSTSNNFFLANLRQWEEEFSSVRNLKREAENESFFEICLRELKDVGDSIEPDEVNVIDHFMTGADPHQTKRLKDFCKHFNTVRCLAEVPKRQNSGASTKSPISEDRTQNQSSKRVAFLFDSNRMKQQWWCREGLSATRLYCELSKPRFSSGSRKGANKAQRGTDQERIDAEQRYVRDLDAQTVCALSATASSSQLSTLQRLIYGHLEFTSSIRVHVPPEGSTFALEFHVPSYILVPSEFPRLDDRNLRNVEDVSFLTRPSIFNPKRRLRDYLYRTQVSVSICGFDEHTFTSYYFTDTYHESPEDIEALGNLEDHEGQGAYGAIGDPFTRGTTVLGAYASQPREFFLTVLQFAIQKVCQDWTQIVTTIEYSFKNLGTDEEIIRLFTLDRQDQSPGPTKERIQSNRDRQKRNEGLAWTRQTTLLMPKLIDCLERIIDSWSIFTSGDVNYYCQDSTPSNLRKSARKTLIAIANEFGELDKLLSRLQNCDKQCVKISEIIHSVHLELAMDRDDATIAEQRTADDVKVLTWITFYMLPFSIPATMLSVRDGFLPLPAHPASYALLTFFVWLVINLLLEKLWGWRRCRQVIENVRAKVQRRWRQDHESIPSFNDAKSDSRP
ncbi:hypothetical protein F5Y18DRAFT_433050 [Xylariaceae sp. FL1019]|nr:hypothetical protein F5Y18DRAFT_433050 [Xylariaceae sp. FL1019]